MRFDEPFALDPRAMECWTGNWRWIRETARFTDRLHEQAWLEQTLEVAVKDGERPAPQMQDNSLAAQVHACGLGLPDWLMTQGRCPIVDKVPVIPGQERAGVVVQASAESRYMTGHTLMVDGGSMIDVGR